jgi:hypothetical protein
MVIILRLRCYIRTVEDFSRRFKCSPDDLGPEHIPEYQAELFKKRELSPGTVTQRSTALRFFYIKTLKKTWSIAETPYPKKGSHLPAILSREEVAQLIDAALTPFHRTLLMTLYANGVRRAELTHPKISLHARVRADCIATRPANPRRPRGPRPPLQEMPNVAMIGRVKQSLPRAYSRSGWKGASPLPRSSGIPLAYPLK